MKALPFAAALGATVCLSTAAPPTACGELSQEVLGSVVMIQTTAEGEAPAIGSGVVLYERDGLLTMISAEHVVFGTSKGSNCGEGKRLHGTSLQLNFYLDAPPAVEAKWSDPAVFSKPRVAKDADLILLRVRLEATPTVPLGIEMLDLEPETVDDPEGGHEVFAVGQFSRGQDRGQWRERRGRILKVTSDVITHTVPIEKGFSGGPLFTEDGKLVGINYCYSTRDDGSIESFAIPIGKVLRTFRGLINPLHIKGEVDEAAHQVFRQGLRAVALKDWDGARELMMKARDQYPLEGNVIHLRGMRYTRYLPSYYLGLAEFRRKDCAAARNAWRAPGLDEGLGGQRRNARLRKMRRVCRGGER